MAAHGSLDWLVFSSRVEKTPKSRLLIAYVQVLLEMCRQGCDIAVCLAFFHLGRGREWLLVRRSDLCPSCLDCFTGTFTTLFGRQLFGSSGSAFKATQPPQSHGGRMFFGCRLLLDHFCHCPPIYVTAHDKTIKNTACIYVSAHVQ
jgi:hypothetical protein